MSTVRRRSAGLGPLVIGFVAAILGGAATVWSWLGIVAAIASAVGAIWAWSGTQTVEVDLAEGDFVRDAAHEDYRAVIPARVVRRRTLIRTMVVKDGRRTEVSCDVEQAPSGEVTIAVGRLVALTVVLD